MAADRFEDKPRAESQRREECEKELDLLDTKLARLRVLYDQYFMGVEKLEPMTLRIEVEKTLLRSRIPSLGSTVQRFRFRALQHRFTSYCGFWDRIVRLIEEGRIRRGVKGTQYRPKEPQLDAVEEPLAARKRRFKRSDLGGEEGSEAANGMASGSQPKLDPQAVSATAPPSPTPPAKGQSLDFHPTDIDSIYERFRVEKETAGQSTDKVTRELLAKSIDRIVTQLPGKEIRIRVTNKDGAISLAAVVKKS